MVVRGSPQDLRDNLGIFTEIFKRRNGSYQLSVTISSCRERQKMINFNNVFKKVSIIYCKYLNIAYIYDTESNQDFNINLDSFTVLH